MYTRYFTLMTIYEFPVIKLKIGLFVIRGEKIFNIRIFIKMFVYILFSLTLFNSYISSFSNEFQIHSNCQYSFYRLYFLLKHLYTYFLNHSTVRLALHSNINTTIVHPSIKFNYQLNP